MTDRTKDAEYESWSIDLLAEGLLATLRRQYEEIERAHPLLWDEFRPVVLREIAAELQAEVDARHALNAVLYPK